jgi:hypothetical protein
MVQLGLFPLHWLHVSATGGLQSPENVHAVDAPVPAAVEHADALPAPIPHSEFVGARHEPLHEQALVAPAPSAVRHAALPLALCPAHTLDGGAVQPPPLKEQNALLVQATSSTESVLQVVASLVFTVHPPPLHVHPI